MPRNAGSLVSLSMAVALGAWIGTPLCAQESVGAGAMADAFARALKRP